MRRRASSRFWEKVVFLPDGCAKWIGGRTTKGYGLFSVQNPPEVKRRHRTVYAHHWIFERAHGPIPDDKVIMHSCDHPWCVSLRHLSLGTDQANVDDAVAKGRHKRGTMDPNAKLDDDKVREIRKLSAQGHSQAAIGAHFGVHQVLISLVMRGKIWKHVK